MSYFYKNIFFNISNVSYVCILVSALVTIMTEIHTGKSKWCKIRTTASLSQDKSQAVPGLWGTMTTLFPPPTSSSKMIHLNYLKMLPQEDMILILFFLGY